MWGTNSYTKHHVLRYLYNRMPMTAASLLHELAKRRNALHLL